MRGLRQRLSHFRRDKRGVVSIITAISGIVLMGFAAGAVDFGSVYLKQRQLQGITDLAALAAASNLDKAQAAADATANDNDLSDPVTATVATGTYSPDESKAAADRYTAGGSSPNAVRVTLSSQAKLYFASLLIGQSSFKISRTATAARAELASFSLGTRLASLNGGLANAILSALTGSSVNLSVMDYNSLASAQVDLFQFSNALKSKADITAASFNDTLDSQVTPPQVLSAISDVLSSSGSSDAATAMRTVAQAANSTPVEVGQLFDLGPYGGQDYINSGSGSGVTVSALDLACAVLQLAQGGRQMQLNISVKSPGLANVTAWLAIGQRPANSPWIAITDTGDVVVRTAQARLYLDVQTAPASPLAGVASVNVPVLVELASAQAKLSKISCGMSTSDNSVSLSVAPSVGSVTLGQIDVANLNDFSTPLTVSDAQLASVLLLLNATGSAKVTAGGDTWQDVSFSGDDITSGTVKTVSTNDIAASSFSSLLGSLKLNVQVLGILKLTLGRDLVTSILQQTLKNVATPLDGVINSLTGILGVGLGQADVRVNGVRCNAVALVQ